MRSASRIVARRFSFIQAEQRHTKARKHESTKGRMGAVLPGLPMYRATCEGRVGFGRIAKARKNSETRERFRGRAGSESVVGSEFLFVWASPWVPCVGGAGSPQTNSIKSAGRAGADARAGASVVFSSFRGFAISRSAGRRTSDEAGAARGSPPHAAPIRLFVFSCAQ